MAKKKIYSPGEILNESGVSFVEEIEPRQKYYRRAIFKCPVCSETFIGEIADVKANKKKSCPTCSEKRVREKARKYYKGQILNEEIDTYIVSDVIYKNGTKKCDIRCGQCGEIFTTDPYEVIRNSGYCNSCANKNRKKLYKVGDIITSKDGNNFLFIEEVSSDSLRRGIFQEIDKSNNPIGPKFQAIVYNVKCGSATGRTSKMNEEIARILDKNSIKYIREKTFQNLKSSNNNLLRYDFYLPDYNILIEYDGEQHFEEISCWGGKEGLEERQKRDLQKNIFAKENNIELIRFSYQDIIEEKFVLNKIYENGGC